MSRTIALFMGRLATAGLCGLLLAACGGTSDEAPKAGPKATQRPASAPSTSLGTVAFNVSCDEAARAGFNQALAMLHHMMYVQARGRFAELAEAHPDCAMAHWGVAITRFQPLWSTRPGAAELRQGWQEIQAAGSAGTDSQRERLLIAATEAFFREPDSAAYATRQQRWAEAMKAAYEAVPEDADVAALYALSRLARAQGADDPQPLHDEAETVLRKVHAREPKHPGAIHYMIHTDDIDGRAQRNLDIVRSYSQIAPDVPHALHMPSHIYVRLGDWPAVLEWNRRSAEAALRHPAGEYVSLHYAHAQDYIVYAHLQRGEDELARRVHEEVLRQGELQRSPLSAFHLAAMPARIAVERRDWKEAAGLEPRSPAELPWDEPMGLWSQSQTWLARGLGAVHTEDLDAARAALEKMQTLGQTAADRDEKLMANYIRLDALLLEGWIAQAGGDADQGVARLREAAALEQRLEKHPATPGALLPPNEALGDMLLALNRPEAALEAYTASDAIWPNRYNTLLGASRAAKAAGDPEAAAQWADRLREVAPDAERAGSEVPGGG